MQDCRVSHFKLEELEAPRKICWSIVRNPFKDEKQLRTGHGEQEGSDCGQCVVTNKCCQQAISEPRQQMVVKMGARHSQEPCQSINLPVAILPHFQFWAIWNAIGKLNLDWWGGRRCPLQKPEKDKSRDASRKGDDDEIEDKIVEQGGRWSKRNRDGVGERA